MRDQMRATDVTRPRAKKIVMGITMSAVRSAPTGGPGALMRSLEGPVWCQSLVTENHFVEERSGEMVFTGFDLGFIREQWRVISPLTVEGE